MAQQRREIRVWSWLEGWGPVVLWACLIFTLSSLPGGSLRLPPIPCADKLAHAGVYGVFALALLRALRRGTSWPAPLLCAVTLGAALVYGISDELHQSFVPGRSVEALDVAADAAGATLACGLWQLVAHLRARSRK
jgi:VanZ family protein